MGGVVRDTFELYAPQVRTIEVDSLGGTGDFELLPTSRALPAVGTSRFCPLVYVWLR